MAGFVHRYPMSRNSCRMRTLCASMLTLLIGICIHSLNAFAETPAPGISPGDMAYLRQQIDTSQSLDDAQALVKQNRPELADSLRHDTLTSARASLSRLYALGVLSFERMTAESYRLDDVLRVHVLHDKFQVQNAYDLIDDAESPGHSKKTPNEAHKALNITRIDNPARDKAGLFAHEDVQTKFTDQYDAIYRTIKEDPASGLHTVDIGSLGFRIEEWDTDIWRPSVDSYRNTVRYSFAHELTPSVLLPDGSIATGLSAEEVISRQLKIRIAHLGDVAPPPGGLRMSDAVAQLYRQSEENSAGPTYSIDATVTNTERLAALFGYLSHGVPGAYIDVEKTAPGEAWTALRLAASDVIYSVALLGLDKERDLGPRWQMLRQFQGLAVDPQSIGGIHTIQSLTQGLFKECFLTAWSRFAKEYTSLSIKLKNASDADKKSLLIQADAARNALVDMLHSYNSLAQPYREALGDMAASLPLEQLLTPTSAGPQDLLPRELDLRMRKLADDTANANAHNAEIAATTVTSALPPEVTTSISDSLSHLNIPLDTILFNDCLVSRPQDNAIDGWLGHCLNAQEEIYTHSALISIGLKTLSVFTPAGDLLDTVTFINGSVMHEGNLPGPRSLELLRQISNGEHPPASIPITEETQTAVSRATRYIERLLKEEALVYGTLKELNSQLRQINADVSESEKRQQVMQTQMPSPQEFDRQNNEYWQRIVAAKDACDQGAQHPAANAFNLVRNMTQTLESATQLLSQCASDASITQADAALTRAQALLANPGNDPTDLLLSEAGQYEKTVKGLYEQAQRSNQDTQGLIQRIDAINAKSLQIESRHRIFVDAMPAEFADLMRLNADRMQRMSVAMDKAIVRDEDNGVHMRLLKRQANELRHTNSAASQALMDYPKRTVGASPGTTFSQIFDTDLPALEQCHRQSSQPSAVSMGNVAHARTLLEQQTTPLAGLRAACLAKRPGNKPATAVASSSAFKPLYLFRLWDQDSSDVHFILYDRVELKGQTFHFRDSSGGVFQSGGENLGQYRDNDSICAVLRSYGVLSVSYYLEQEPHVQCSKEGPSTRANILQTTAKATPGSGRVSEVSGTVTLKNTQGEIAANTGPLAPPATIITASDGHLTWISYGNTSVQVLPDSKVKLLPMETGEKRATIYLSTGSIEINHPAGIDDVNTTTPDAAAIAVGTHYQVSVNEQGTAYHVLEGSIRISGERLIKTDAGYHALKKSGWQNVLTLKAGEYAFSFRNSP